MRFQSGDDLLSEEASIEDVREFFDELLDQGFNFHPDEEGAGYVGETGEASFTIGEAREYDRLMARAFEVCGYDDTDVYDVSIERFEVYMITR